MMAQEAYKRDCLARWLLDHWETRQARRESFERMRENITRSRGQAAADAFIQDLDARIQTEWDRRREARAA